MCLVISMLLLVAADTSLWKMGMDLLVVQCV